MNGEVELNDVIWLDSDSEEEYRELFGEVPEARAIVIDDDDDEERVSPTPSVAHSEPGEEYDDDGNGMRSPNLGIGMARTAMLFESPTWEQLRMAREKSGREIAVSDVYAAAMSISQSDLRCDDGVSPLINGKRSCVWSHAHCYFLCKFTDGGQYGEDETEEYVTERYTFVPTEPYTMFEMSRNLPFIRRYWRMRNDCDYLREQADVQVLYIDISKKVCTPY